MRFYFIILSFFVSFKLFAQGIEVVAPAVAPNVNSNLALPTAVGGDFTINIYPHCYGTNLRSISNPLAPNASVDMRINFDNLDPIELQFIASLAGLPGGVKPDALAYLDDPAYLNVGRGPLSPAKVTLLNQKYVFGTIKASLGLISIPITNFPATITSIDKFGNITVSKQPQTVTTTYSQVVAGGLQDSKSWSADGQHPGGCFTSSCSFFAFNGPMSYTQSPYRLTASSLDIDVAFPGQQGYCGGFHSPLMLFFDKKLPEFSATSNYTINGMKTLKAWPEANAPGYFLALRKKPGTAVQSEDDIQLFGADGVHKNGFEALKELDKNHDGVIDINDKEFKNLVLWKDSSGKGLVLEKDLKSLSSAGVLSIRVRDYNSDNVNPVGAGAQLREESTFEFVNKKTGNHISGKIVDVYFESK